MVDMITGVSPEQPLRGPEPVPKYRNGTVKCNVAVKVAINVSNPCRVPGSKIISHKGNPAGGI